jgi:DNA polymerase elongation subunit (family B)
MYKTSGGEAKNIYTYDVNSLYPFVMSSFLL